MRTTLTSTSLIAASLLTALAILAPVTAAAREGAQSVGNGIKCYTAAVPQADGTVKYQRICYKGV
jgi:uncharacterized membrane protein